MKRVFIDGSAGTTGLRIRERLSQREDIELITLSEELRKDTEARRKALNGSDVAFLCLPDAAAVEAVELVSNPETVIIDTSTAHRTADGWEYGFPELEGRRERIAAAKRIANPGCHASGFVALVEPLVRKRLVTVNERIAAFSLTGYSGGGKKMIADYETAGTNLHIGGRQYALGQKHKHLPEMAKVCGFVNEPCFSPIVVPHLSGMEVTVQLFASQFREAGTTLEQINDVYREYYGEEQPGGGGAPPPPG
ncbi:MAG: N-acetyl-gamma-glutamyl-phosphate reductase, partial [bacterium]|nr:N-acetyl-gamma-glutamyl-phosphate reductase [Candidatus Colisoma equi]